MNAKRSIFGISLAAMGLTLGSFFLRGFAIIFLEVLMHPLAVLVAVEFYSLYFSFLDLSFFQLPGGCKPAAQPQLTRIATTLPFTYCHAPFSDISLSLPATTTYACSQIYLCLVFVLVWPREFIILYLSVSYLGVKPR
jgi:hypothetical protein